MKHLFLFSFPLLFLFPFWTLCEAMFTLTHDTGMKIVTVAPERLPCSAVCVFSCPGQFPSTFVEEVTIPSARPGDRLYVCINDFNSAQTGNLPLQRGADTLAAEKRVS